MASACHRLDGVAGTILVHHHSQSAEQAAAESSAWQSGLGVWSPGRSRRPRRRGAVLAGRLQPAPAGSTAAAQQASA